MCVIEQDVEHDSFGIETITLKTRMQGDFICSVWRQYMYLELFSVVRYLFFFQIYQNRFDKTKLLTLLA